MKTKSFFMALLSLCLLASCGKAGQLEAERDSLLNLTKVQSQRIESLDNVMSTINGTLDSIATQEGMLFVGNGEAVATKSQVLKNLERYEKMLAGQKEQIALLEKDLELQKTKNGQDVADAQKMLENFKTQLAEKDAEIADLRQQIEQKNMDIASLQNQVSSQSMTISNQTSQINKLTEQNARNKEALERQDKVLNNCYVLIDTKDGLQSRGILKKGKLVSNAMMDRSQFKKVDTRKVGQFNFEGKKPKVLTNMPSSAYTLTTSDKKNWTLKITDPGAFWRVSNYLVIQTD